MSLLSLEKETFLSNQLLSCGFNPKLAQYFLTNHKKMTEKEDFYRVLVSEARPNPVKVEETSVNKILQYGLSTGLIFFVRFYF